MTIPQIIADIQFTAGVWTNVSQWLLHSISVQRGSSRVESPVIRYEPGRATVKLNNSDRRFDPTNLSGPYVSGGNSLVTPMRPIRIRATWDGVTYDLFRGFTDEFAVDWVPGVYSEVTVPSTDGFKVLTSKRRTPTVVVTYDENSEPVFTTVKFGEGEDTGARVHRILDSADWPIGDRVIASGVSSLQATPLEGDALEELYRTVETEIGECYIDGAGRVVFRNRHAILTEARSTTVQASFGASFTPMMTKLSTDDATMWNEASTSRSGGITQTVEDSASVARNRYKTFSASDLLFQDDLTARNYGQWIVYTSKDPENRFDSITLYPGGNPDTLYPQVLGREIGDRIQITVTPPGGGSPITRQVFIRGITHSISQENWVTTWLLQSATRYTANFFVLNSATNGVLNQNVLSF
jgi:hypothetical protein